mmetsp:Transcript_11860/g.36631  ORF Transcript_11860/g.36631 Transcript_11860/m.36631 type:complete len:230 (-) Transcript_11860:545-1234(-)
MAHIARTRSASSRLSSASGSRTVSSISSNLAGQICMSASISGIGLEYRTEGAGFCICNSLMLLIHLLIWAGDFSAPSIDFTLEAMFATPEALDTAFSWSVSTVGSLCVAAVSSRTVSPRLSGLPSGRGTLTNGSISPTAGIYSATKGRIFVSSSILCGLYRPMYWNSSATSGVTSRSAYSEGSYIPSGTGPPAPRSSSFSSDELIAGKSRLTDPPISPPAGDSMDISPI